MNSFAAARARFIGPLLAGIQLRSLSAFGPEDVRYESVIGLSLPKTLFKLTRGLRRNQNIIAA